MLGGEKVLEHCIYTLANAVAAGIVHKAAHWKGFKLAADAVRQAVHVREAADRDLVQETAAQGAPKLAAFRSRRLCEPIEDA